MGFGEAIASGFSNYVTFSGRASRSEYWFWTLFATLVSVAAAIVDIGLAVSTGYSPFSTLVNLVLFLPGIAVSARRLHDLDRTAWWLLLVFTIIGAILLLVWDCMKGTDGPNRFGPDPFAGGF